MFFQKPQPELNWEPIKNNHFFFKNIYACCKRLQWDIFCFVVLVGDKIKGCAGFWICFLQKSFFIFVQLIPFLVIPLYDFM